MIDPVSNTEEQTTRSKDPMKLYTIGHSNRPLNELIAMLKEQGILCLVDVRSRPGSGRFPWFNKPALEQALEQAGIQYLWEGKDLGGKRLPSPADFHHRALERGFRAFASHLATPAFRAGVDRLLSHARTHRTAILCAEKDPRHCHRSLIADYLSVRGYEVRHLLAPGEQRHHVLHPALWIEGQGLYYGRPAGTLDLFAGSEMV
jgi:uncharacterized protein (DUF488 family)